MALLLLSSFWSLPALAASAQSSSLEISYTVNGQRVGKPGPLLATGSTSSIAISVRNTGATTLYGISINGRQKLPQLQPWNTLCTVLRLSAGEIARCTVNQRVPAGVFKALVVASTSSNGATVQALDNIFLRGAANAGSGSDTAYTPPSYTPASNPVARLSLRASVNSQTSTRPGPEINTEAANWTYTVSNDGNVRLGQVVVRARQKLPTLQPWRIACTLEDLDPGASGQCDVSEGVVSGQFKALVVGRAVSANGEVVEALTDTFYRSNTQQGGNAVPEQQPTSPNIAPAGNSGSGYKSLFAGHSFFNPIANEFTWLAAHAGFTDHEQTVVYSSGPTGAPEALWNDAENRATIQSALDQGDIELFGLTYHDDYPSHSAYIRWADYALEKNPNTAIFIAMPWGRWPGRYNVSQMEQFWSHHHENVVHRIIDTLRNRHPGKRFFCVPYGMASSQLKDLQVSGNLPDVQQLIGDHLTSVYNDELGHTGVLMKRLGALVWLSAIYGVDLSQFDYHDPYITDLKTLAGDIMAVHNSHYDDRQD